MTGPQETEVRFQDLLEVLGLPIPAGYHLLAVARFLQELTSPVDGESYIVEIAERLPMLRSASDVEGIDPILLERSLRTLQQHLARSPSLADEEMRRGALSTFPRGLALSFWMVGEHARALHALGVRPEAIPGGITELEPGRSAEALAQAVRVLSGSESRDRAALGGLLKLLDPVPARETVCVPVIERFSDRGSKDQALHGFLRRFAIGALEWSSGVQDEVDANTALVGFEGDWTALLAPPLGAARTLLAEQGHRAPERKVRLQLVLDRPGAFHEGSSANLALTALLFCHLLRKTGARQEFALRGGSAVTGVIDETGEVLAVEPHHLASKVEAGFFSHLRRLVVPATQLEAARRTLAALHERYPRRNLELYGVNHVRELFFDRRITHHRRISLPLQGWRAAWGLRRPIAAVVVILLVGALAASWVGPLDRDPVSATFRGEMLVLQNKSGQDLREIRVGRPTVEHARLLAVGGIDREVVTFFDVNGDGSKEVLYILRAEEGSSDPQSLVCLGATEDNPLWTFVARFRLDFPHKTDLASDAFRLEEIWTGDSDGDGRAEVILLANHVFFPSVIARLDATTGELQQVYIHVGTLSDLAVVDLEADGVFDILACGTNNAFNMASLVVLDSRSLRGHSPTTGAYVMDGVPRATERVYALIPRTAVGEVFAERYERIGARNLELEPAGKRFCVLVPDAGGPVTFGSVDLDPLLYYYFGFDLKPQRIATSTEFDTVCRLLWERGDLIEPPGKTFFEGALKNIRYLQSTSSSVAGSSALSRRPAPPTQDSPRSGHRGE